MIDYIDNHSNMAIIGGYMTSMYFEVPFFEESDIDIYIFESQLDSLTDLINFLDDTYKIDSVEILGSSVRSFILKEFNRKIQVILVEKDNILDIMLTFDCTHNRCAYYLKNTYITFDAEYSKKHQKNILF